MNTEAMPQFEEFEKEVRAHFIGLSKTLTTDETNAYLDGEEAQTHIRNAYDSKVKRFMEGKISRDVFMIGGVSSVAYCLFMMY